MENMMIFPKALFYMVGGIEEAREKAEKMAETKTSRSRCYNEKNLILK